MSNDIELTPASHSEAVQEFLFACAFWAVAADEKLAIEEQDWLTEQFGEDRSGNLLQQISSLSNDAFFNLFDDLVRALSDDEKRAVYPKLAPWIVSCIASDGEVAAIEATVAEEIMARAGVESELMRLSGGLAQPAEQAEAAEPTAQAPIPAGELVIKTLTGHGGSLNDVAFSPDGELVVSAAEDGTAKVWSATGEEKCTLEQHACGVTCVAYSPDGKNIATGDRTGEVIAWNAADGSVAAETILSKQGGISSVAYSPDSTHILTASEVGILALLNASDLSEVTRFGETHSGVVYDAVFSPDGKSAASAGDDSQIRIWSSDGKLIKVLEGHTGGVLSIRYSADGSKLVSGSRDNTVRLWDAESGSEIKVFKGHSFTVYGVCMSPDGRYILSGSADHTARLWDVESGQLIRSHEQYTSGFSRAAFSPDGKSAVVAGTDNTLYLFENLV